MPSVPRIPRSPFASARRAPRRPAAPVLALPGGRGRAATPTVSRRKSNACGAVPVVADLPIPQRIVAGRARCAGARSRQPPMRSSPSSASSSVACAARRTLTAETREDTVEDLAQLVSSPASGARSPLEPNLVSAALSTRAKWGALHLLLPADPTPHPRRTRSAGSQHARVCPWRLHHLRERPVLDALDTRNAATSAASVGITDHLPQLLRGARSCGRRSRWHCRLCF